MAFVRLITPIISNTTVFLAELYLCFISEKQRNTYIDDYDKEVFNRDICDVIQKKYGMDIYGDPKQDMVAMFNKLKHVPHLDIIFHNHDESRQIVTKRTIPTRVLNNFTIYDVIEDEYIGYENESLIPYTLGTYHLIVVNNTEPNYIIYSDNTVEIFEFLEDLIVHITT